MTGLIRYNTATGRLGFYNSEAEAGNGMPVYHSADELAASSVPTEQLLNFYNEATGSATKKFRTRKDGASTIFNAIAQGRLKGGNGFAELNGADDDEAHQGAQDAGLEASEDALGNAQEQEASEAGSAPEARQGGSKRRGRLTAAMSGKRLTALRQVNPRKAGTSGHRSYQLLLDAGGSLSWEEYRERGGKYDDLRWDINHGWASIS